MEYLVDDPCGKIPIYGFASGDPLQFRRVVGHKDLFYIDDKELDFKDVIEAALPKAPLDTSIVCHWLAIEGVQPTIPENAHVEVIAAPSDNRKPEQKDDELPVDIKLPVKHVLSRELQVTQSFKEALVRLATDSGLHPLIPYFTYFIADEVQLSECYSFAHSYETLHQLMPSVVTCLVAKRLGNRFADNHWELRDFTAKLVASICQR
ncbi:Transcription initiation factor TFIID subunit 6 [Sarracenia purpurea var. burkii]